MGILKPTGVLQSVETTVMECQRVLAKLLKLWSDFQVEVGDFIGEEIGTQQMDTLVAAKLSRITSKVAIASKRTLKFNFEHVVGVYKKWRVIAEKVGKISSSMRKGYDRIPSTLALMMFFHGEYYKGLMCLMDYSKLVPEDTLVHENIIKWSIYLGEWEVVENFVSKIPSRLKTDLQWYIDVAFLYIDYCRNAKERHENAKKLIEILEKERSGTECTYPAYDRKSFINWIASTLQMVASPAELPEPIHAIEEASNTSEVVVRNRMRPFAYVLNDYKVRTSIVELLKKDESTSSDRVRLGTSFAWNFEMHLERINRLNEGAQMHELAAGILLSWQCALRSGVHFRVLQVLNKLLLLERTSILEGLPQEENVLLTTVINLLAPKSVTVTCTTPEKNAAEEGPSAVKSSVRVTIEDAFAAFGISKELHEISENCQCHTCSSYRTNYNFAAEFCLVRAISEKFSQKITEELETEFHVLREMTRKDQCDVLGSNVKPRPAVTLCVNFSTLVVRWLGSRKKSTGQLDANAMKIVEATKKIVRYSPLQTLPQSLLLRHHLRRLQASFASKHPWMQPTEGSSASSSVSNVVKITIACAKDVLRAVSPFGDRKAATNVGSSEDINSEECFKEAYKDIRDHSHLYHREWRFAINTYLGLSTPDRWLKALAWVDSSAIGTRNIFRIRTKIVPHVTARDFLMEFKQQVKNLPPDMTIVQLCTGEDGSLHMVKLHAARTPLVIPIAHKTKVDEMMRKLKTLLVEDERLLFTSRDTTPAMYWEMRRAIDDRIARLLTEVERKMLYGCAHLFLPSAELPASCVPLINEMTTWADKTLTTGDVSEIIWLAHVTERVFWTEAVERICQVLDVPYDVTNRVLQNYLKIKQTLEKSSIPDTNRYTYFVIAPDIAQFPWEYLSVFDLHRFVTRAQSVRVLFDLIQDKPQVPLAVDVKNAFYVLDPDNDLGETKRRMIDMISQFPWKGVVGASPSTETVTEAMTTMDMFFYFGHGSGSKHISRRTVKEINCNSVNMLMGCGSVKTKPQGQGFDGRNVVNDYALAKCPLIVGCLWTVTDGEIDRYTARVVNACFTMAAKRKNGTSGDYLRHIMEAMQVAREKCKLKYLTGCAVVTYGLPIHAKKESIEGIGPSEEASPARSIRTPRAKTPVLTERRTLRSTNKRTVFDE